MPKAKVLKKEIWWDGRSYHEGDQIDYDLRDLSEMKMKHVIGEIELEQGERNLPPTSPPTAQETQAKSDSAVGVMTTKTASALVDKPYGDTE
jgi:hypothetical protein